MKDFLNNDLSTGDNVLINQNTRTGSSTVRKLLKQATVTGFTKCKIKTTLGDVFPDDIIKTWVFNNKPLNNTVENQTAIECLKEVKHNMYDNLENGMLETDNGEMFCGGFIHYGDMADIIDNKIKELEGEK